MKRVCFQRISRNHCESFIKFVYYTPMLTKTAYSILRIVTRLKVRITQSSEILYIYIKKKIININNNEGQWEGERGVIR